MLMGAKRLSPSEDPPSPNNEFLTAVKRRFMGGSRQRVLTVDLLGLPNNISNDPVPGKRVTSRYKWTRPTGPKREELRECLKIGILGTARNYRQEGRSNKLDCYASGYDMHQVVSGYGNQAYVKEGNQQRIISFIDRNETRRRDQYW